MSYSFHCAITGTFENYRRVKGRAVHPDTVEFRSTSQATEKRKYFWKLTNFTCFPVDTMMHFI